MNRYNQQNQKLIFLNTNKIDKTLAKLIKKKRRKTQITSVRNVAGQLRSSAEETFASLVSDIKVGKSLQAQRTERDNESYYKPLYALKFDNLEEIQQSLKDTF